MPDDGSDYKGMELLGEGEGTGTREGQLVIGADGKAKRQAFATADDGRPSLSGPQPMYGHSEQRGLGGTMVAPQRPVAPRAMTPQEMMAAADAMEKDFLKQGDRSSHVDPRLIGTPDGPDLDPALKRQLGQGQEPPDWLSQYMSNQPYSDPYHQIMPGRVDLLGSNKYLSEKERLKMLRDEQRTAGLR